MTDYIYPGEELELFKSAVNWKSYWHSRIEKYLHGHVLEVGAGNGNNTRFILSRGIPTSWTSVEPDANLFQGLESVGSDFPTSNFNAIQGTLQNVGSDLKFDTILYLDVLEHIEDDRGEIAAAAAFLRPGGHIIVLSPALPKLYSPFDKAIGHYRRYNRAMIEQIQNTQSTLAHVEYLDICGVLASYANRYFLKQDIPTPRQIMTWDKFLVPASTFFDRLICHRYGKSILAVWRRVDEVST